MRIGVWPGLGVGMIVAGMAAGCLGPRRAGAPAPPGNPTPPEPAAQALWPEETHRLSAKAPAETVTNRPVEQNALGLNRSISHVHEPALFAHRPAPGAGPAPAVVICPGGGFRRIVIDKEGHDIARRLNRDGIVGAVLKYRTGPMGAPECLADARRAIRTLRANAEALGIDPTCIGVMGFSAGGHLALRAALDPAPGDEAAADPVERVSSRPDFACIVYPTVPEGALASVTGTVPPAFFVHSFDDRLPISDVADCIKAWKAAGVPAEAHLYATGGHAYGLGVRGGPVTSWPDLFINWLENLAR